MLAFPLHQRSIAVWRLASQAALAGRPDLKQPRRLWKNILS